MKKLLRKILTIAIITTYNWAYSQNVGINGTGAAPDASAILDIDASDKGLLIPRVSINDALAAAPVTSPSLSLLVYNTNSTILNGNGVGYYYWDSSKWVKLYDGPLSGDAWLLLGNSGTNPSTNFLGTIDAQDLVFRTNNIENMRINTSGNVDIGAAFNDARIYARILSSDLTTNYGLYVYHDGGITSGTTYGIRNTNNSSTSGSKYGIYNYTDNEGTGTRYGIYNATYLNSSSNLSSYGFYNYTSTSGSSSSALQRGIYNYFSSSAATGLHYGIQTYLYLNPSSASLGDCGQWTYVDYTSGARYGDYKEMASSTSATGIIYGDYSYVYGFGNDDIFGIVADIPNTGTGTHYGLYSNTPGGTNDYAAMFVAGNVVMNEDGGNYDVRIEGSTMQNLFVADASQNKIGIGVSTPTFLLDIDEPSSAAPTYVYRGRNSSATGTRTQIGSVEYFQDESSTIDFTGGSNFSINLNASASYDLQLAYNSAAKPGSNTWTVASDRRLKEDVNPFKDGLETIKGIDPVYFKYNGKANIKDDHYFIGVIAQDIEKVAPYMVGSFESTPGNIPFEEQEANTQVYKSVDNGAMTYIAINAIKELDAKLTKMAEQLKTISDFGIAKISDSEIFVKFSPDFTSMIEDIPVITITPINSSVSLTIINRTKEGFTVKMKEPNNSVDFNWIALAKLNESILSINKNYSQAERELMLSKVKAESAQINYDSEYEEIKKRKLEKTVEEQSQLNKKNTIRAIPAYNEEDPSVEKIEKEESDVPKE